MKSLWKNHKKFGDVNEMCSNCCPLNIVNPVIREKAIVMVE